MQKTMRYKRIDIFVISKYILPLIVHFSFDNKISTYIEYILSLSSFFF